MSMQKISKTYTLNAASNVIFDALVNPDTIQKWSGAPAQMETTAGSDFSLFGGQVTGKTLEVVNGKKLVQQWPSNTKVTIALSANGDATTVDLLHENIPEDEVEKFTQGWNEFYFGRMEKMFNG